MSHRCELTESALFAALAMAGHCPRLPPKPRLRRRIIVPLWRISGAPLWVLLLILKIFDTVELSQRFLLDVEGCCSDSPPLSI